MDPYIEQQQREQAKRRQEQLEKRDERDRPFDVVKYQHELNLKLLQEQHQLNLEIHSKQAKLIKFTTYMTISATILATLLGVGLGWYLSTKSEVLPKSRMQSEQLTETKKTVQEQIDKGASLPIHHKAIGEPLEQTVIVLKNISSGSPVKNK